MHAKILMVSLCYVQQHNINMISAEYNIALNTYIRLHKISSPMLDDMLIFAIFIKEYVN